MYDRLDICLENIILERINISAEKIFHIDCDIHLCKGFSHAVS